MCRNARGAVKRAKVAHQEAGACDDFGLATQRGQRR
jgi:hypothetical protein